MKLVYRVDTFERCLARVQGHCHLCVNAYVSGHNGIYHPPSCLGRGYSDLIPEWRETGGREYLHYCQRSIDAFVC